MSFFPDSCELSADVLSCEAQTYLAKKEVQRNKYLFDYTTIHPLCPMMNQLADREMEYHLQKSQPTSLKTCYTPPPIKGTQFSNGGQWEYQFATLNPAPPQFDQVTKARFNTHIRQ